MHETTGSCNCGATRYEVRGEIRNVVNCHCGLCRKMNGAAFSTYVVVSERDFTLLNGELKSCSVSGDATKSICSVCGTPIFNENPRYGGLKILHLGSLDNTTGLAPQLNIYCDNQVSWLDDISKFTALAQGIE